MKRAILLLVSWLLVAGTPFSLLGHPGHEHPDGETSTAQEEANRNTRAWKLKGSPFVVDGAFVMARDGVVQIRGADDSLQKIAMDDLSETDARYVEQRMRQIREAIILFQLPTPNIEEQTVALKKADTKPPIALHFEPFVKRQKILTHWDDEYFYVESSGIPDHPMMVGIRSWQQQVPLPQKYLSNNAWQIPLRPVPAKTPVMAKNRFLRGAIALAVNGVPIFNPLNNRGDDAYKFGELDEYGGHCGRADDYHYHIAPVHLEEIVGKGEPIAYALDGYPIYGYQDKNDPDFGLLDRLSGHKDADGNYHYHATKTYPYVNAGFHGVVTERGGQVDPQPRSEPIRPALPPLRDAKITKFEKLDLGSYELTYDVRGKTGTVTYQMNDDGSVDFEFVDPSGRKSEQTYTPNRRRRR